MSRHLECPCIAEAYRGIKKMAKRIIVLWINL
jgi:hypothetical protein